MVEYISKEEAYRTLNSLYNDLDSLDEEEPELWVDGFIGIAIGKIDDMPAADVAPVVHGHWVYNPNGMDFVLGAWECSICGIKKDNLPCDRKINPYNYIGSKYCPNCGAKMDEER